MESPVFQERLYYSCLDAGTPRLWSDFGPPSPRRFAEVVVTEAKRYYRRHRVPGCAVLSRYLPFSLPLPVALSPPSSTCPVIKNAISCPPLAIPDQGS